MVLTIFTEASKQVLKNELEYRRIFKVSALFNLQVTQPNFQVVAEFIRDCLAEAKLAFFISLATLVEPF